MQTYDDQGILKILTQGRLRAIEPGKANGKSTLAFHLPEFKCGTDKNTGEEFPVKIYSVGKPYVDRVRVGGLYLLELAQGALKNRQDGQPHDGSALYHYWYNITGVRSPDEEPAEPGDAAWDALASQGNGHTTNNGTPAPQRVNASAKDVSILRANTGKSITTAAVIGTKIFEQLYTLKIAGIEGVDGKVEALIDLASTIERGIADNNYQWFMQELEA